MPPYVLAALAAARQREICAEYKRCPAGRRRVRRAFARLLRTCGDRLLRLGVALDEARVPAAEALKSLR
jgi:hypothetical protein